MVKRSQCSIKNIAFLSGGIASDSDSTLVHEDLELEDEDLLLDEEEELETKPGSHEEQLDSVSVPSLSEAS